MASIGLLGVSFAFLCFLILSFLFNKKTHGALPTNWPFLGMFPGLLAEVPRIYDWTVEALEDSNLTFVLKGPWFAGMDILATVDPANVHHVMTSNFSNYTKGFEFKEVFDVLGDGIFNTDTELWKNLRKSTQAILKHQGFQRFALNANLKMLKKGLLPLLDHVAEKKMVVDLQDVFQRFTYDTAFMLSTGHDIGSLSIGMPEVEFYKALDDVEEAITYRHLKPRTLWKLQKWIGFGVEKRMIRAYATLDRVCAKHVAAKRKEIRSGIHHSDGEAMDLLTCYMNVDTSKYKLLNPYDEKFLRDTILTFMFAGRGTGSAFARLFWLLSKNPEALTKIRQEINTKLPRNHEWSFDPKEINKLVYLHGVLCETLRLYPPLPFQRRTPTKSDVLPSGHKVEANSKIVFFLYAMGRMKAIWGEDASDFKPERWISESGELRYEPSFKFVSFNTGPRTCAGKEMCLTRMKTVAVEIIHNYDIKIMEGQRAESVLSFILHIKEGLKVTITKRCSA